MLGTESDVRLDAEITGDTLTTSVQLPITYIVTNNRPTPIGIAELVPESSYDPDTRLVTVSLGSEVPGEQFLPRLILVSPGEKKSFAVAARISIPMSGGTPSPFVPVPSGIQLKLNFLGDLKPFAQLVGIPERAIQDPKLAADLFPKWVEGNETLVTNVLPMRWGGVATGPGGADVRSAQPPPRPRP